MKVLSKSALFVALLLASAEGCAAVPQNYTTDTTVEGSTETYEGTGYVIRVTGNANVTMNGVETVNATSTTGETVVFDVTNGNLTAGTIDITVAPKAGIANTYPKGMIVRGNSKVIIDTLKANATLTSVNANAAAGPDSNASYGLAVGYNFSGGSAADTASITLNNSDIKVTNTADTTVGEVRRTFLGVIPVSMKSGHQLSGIRIYRTNGAKPEFVSNGKVDIEVTDSSTAKSGDYLAGIYISGNDASATFNGETNIKVAANGVNSAGIKIGKPLETSNDGATVTVNGKLTLDTTATDGTATIAGNTYRGSGAVRLFGNNSKFIVTGANTDEASVIKASTNAIVFDTQDYVTTGSVFALEEALSRNASNKNNMASLRNTLLSTTSETDALIKANAKNVKAGLMMQYGSSFVNGKLNSGTFSVEDAVFNLSGQLSKATAAPKGWAIHAYGEQAETGAAGARSILTANIFDSAAIVGLMHKDADSTLKINVSDFASWQLAKKEDAAEQLSTVSSINLSLNGKLDAGTNLTDGSKAEYIIKLTSDGTASDGMLTNDGIITMINDSYEDKLTIDGNYVGNGGRLNINTLWNSTGDAVGGNSLSDLLTITGTATGNTAVIPIATDGSEAIIDGSIGSITADLHSITVPVVHVQTEAGSDATAFTGTAKTTGAGELQLKSRLNDDGTRDYFWEITATNPKLTPIYDKSVPGYVQMPQVDLDLSYASIRTLHERRGENHRAAVTPEATGGKPEQTWARVVKDYLKIDGKDRFNYTNHINGIQVGHDFKIKEYNDNSKRFSGIYFSYLQGKADFFDAYKSENGVVTSDKFTGSGKADNYSLGTTTTKYGPNGAYIDLVGQLSLIRNKYSALDSKSVKQHGWGFGASLEAGRPHILKESDNKRLMLEPQGQIIFQYLNLNDITHNGKFIQQSRQFGLKGRIGARLSYDTYDEGDKVKNTVYGIVNIWQDVTGAHAVSVGRDRLNERYARTVGEIGLGAQLRLSDFTHFYCDLRYQHSLGSGNTTGYRGNIGLKYTF